jgi:hypothetical protein
VVAAAAAVAPRAIEPTRIMMPSGSRKRTAFIATSVGSLEASHLHCITDIGRPRHALSFLARQLTVTGNSSAAERLKRFRRGRHTGSVCMASRTHQLKPLVLALREGAL